MRAKSHRAGPVEAEAGERRNTRARIARDRLARLLKIETGELRRLTADQADALAAAIERELAANGPRP